MPTNINFTDIIMRFVTYNLRNDADAATSLPVINTKINHRKKYKQENHVALDPIRLQTVKKVMYELIECGDAVISYCRMD